MSETKELPKELPSMETVIDLDVKGQVTGRQYKGQFTFKIPSGKQNAKADIKRATLNGGIQEEFLDPTVAEFHYWIAFLYYTISSPPKWWENAEFGYALHDVNVVQDLYKACSEFQSKWMKQVWGEPNGESSKEPS